MVALSPLAIRLILTNGVFPIENVLSAKNFSIFVSSFMISGYFGSPLNLRTIAQQLGHILIGCAPGAHEAGPATSNEGIIMPSSILQRKMNGCRQIGEDRGWTKRLAFTGILVCFLQPFPPTFSAIS
jgi:hypothetical protein